MNQCIRQTSPLENMVWKIIRRIDERMDVEAATSANLMATPRIRAPRKFTERKFTRSSALGWTS